MTDEQREEAAALVDEDIARYHRLKEGSSEQIVTWADNRLRILYTTRTALEPKTVTREWAACLASVIQAESHYTDAADVLLVNLKTEFGIEEG
uniref:Uncharacterized protein n=1 Tax=viral metagenome TaxID=1070528 RepID=A0A6M3IGS2_9ZZZZ